MPDYACPHVARVVRVYQGGRNRGNELARGLQRFKYNQTLLRFCGKAHQKARTTSTDVSGATRGTHGGMRGHASTQCS